MTDPDAPADGDDGWQGSIVRLGNGLPIEVDARDLVGGFIARHGYWEAETVAFVERWLRPGMTMVDAGAHVGQYAMVASRGVGPRGRVHAFEPHPALFAALRRNLDRAGCANVVARPLALGSVEHERPFFLHAGNLGASSLRAVAERDRAVRVQVTTLDAHLAAHGGRRVDLLKIDVEGSERDLLAGAVGTLEASPDIVLVIEFLRPNARRFGYALEDLERDLRGRGFHLFALSPHGLAPYTPAGEVTVTVVAARRLPRLFPGLSERQAAQFLLRLRHAARRQSDP
jgi:FkbM family methyltransferase